MSVVKCCHEIAKVKCAQVFNKVTSNLENTIVLRQHFQTMAKSFFLKYINHPLDSSSLVVGLLAIFKKKHMFSPIWTSFFIHVCMMFASLKILRDLHFFFFYFIWQQKYFAKVFQKVHLVRETACQPVYHYPVCIGSKDSFKLYINPRTM